MNSKQAQARIAGEAVGLIISTVVALVWGAFFLACVAVIVLAVMAFL